MKRRDFDPVLVKIGIFDGQAFSPAQADAWFEVLGEHSQADALDGVLAFYSKPFKRPAYPGDIKALVLETEGVRLRRCGTLEVNEEEWFNGPTAPVYARLRRLIATGEWTVDDYRVYRRSGLTLDELLAKQEARVG